MLRSEAKKKIAKIDSKLIASDFNRDTMVEIRTQDGCYYSLKSAFYIGVDEWVMVFTEHYGYYLFAKDEVEVQMWSK